MTVKSVFLVKYGAASQAFEVRDSSTKPEPGPGQLRVAVEAFGLNYADVMARKGLYQDAPPIPAVLGYEVVGRVEALGAGVDGPKPGTRVAALTRFGGYATHAITDARAVAAIPDDMDVGIAAAIPTQGATAWFCAEEMVRLHAGDHVLVQAAAGGVGTLLVQLAKRHGCVVYGTAGSEEKLDYLKKLGVDVPINYRTTDFAEVIERKRGDEGIDVVFDSLGGAAIRKGLKLVRAGGRVVAFGAAEHEAGSLQVLRSLKFLASFGFPHPVLLMMASKSFLAVNMLRVADQRPLIVKRCLENVIDLVLRGELTPHVGGRFTVDRIADAHAFLENRGSMGKIVVSWA
ncbi:MAG: zinc-binding dehydrogenase [bacterium]